MGEVLWLYLVTRTDVWGYDDYDAMVVAARNSGHAVTFHPSGSTERPAFESSASWGSSWVSDAGALRVEMVGRAKPGSTAGVVLASFNPG